MSVSGTTPSMPGDDILVSPTIFRSGKRRLLLLIGLCMVLVITALSLYVAIYHQGQVRRADKATALRTDQLAYEAAIQQSDRQRGQRQYDAAIATLTTYAGQAQDRRRRALAQAQVGVVYEVRQDYTSALSWYRRAEATAPREELGIDQGIARSSVALGDKATGLAYYQRVLAFIKRQIATGQPGFGDDDVSDVQATISQLQVAP